MTKEIVNLIISSRNLQKDILGSTVYISLPQALDLTGTKNLSIISASTWYNYPNITDDLIINNNKIRFTYQTIIYTITFIKGLYSLSDIQETLSEKLSNLNLPRDLISFEGDNATSLITMYLKTNNPLTIDFQHPDNKMLKDLLGYTQSSVSTTVPLYIDSESRARLNKVDSLCLNVSFSTNDKTIFNNFEGSTVCALIPLDGQPGSLINFTPSNPMICQITAGVVSNFSISLRDQNNTENSIDCNGEDFSCHIQITDA